MAEENMTEEESKEPKEPRSYSRRRFLFGSGLVVGGAVAAGVAGSALAPTTAEAGGGETAVAPSMDQACVQNAQAQLQKAMGHVSHNSAICTGCRSCEALCSLNREGLSNPALARIQVSTDYFSRWKNQAITCKQCDAPNCLAVCPTGALHVAAKTGARVIDATKCIGCQRCIKACPQYPNSPIQYNAEKKVSFKCDLCDGNPLCVSYCPEGALSLVTGEA
jgi:Fe-S-cluster-containing hydrogenase component 2